MLIIAFIVFLFFFILAAKRPLLALVGLVALLPAYNLRFIITLPFGALAKYGGLPSTMLEVIIWAVFFGWLSSSLLWKRRGGEDFIILKSRLQKIKYPLAIFFLASIISVFVAPDLYKAVGLWRAFFLESILIFFLILAIIKDKNDFQKIIFGLGISAFYVSAIAIGQKFFGLPNPFLEDVSRASSIFPQPNMLGLYLGPIIILMLGQIIKSLNHKNIKSSVYYGINIFLSVLAIIFAKSDGAIVAVVAGVGIFLLLLNKMSKKILLLAILFSIFYFLFSNNFSFINEKLLLRDWSGTVRLQIWKESWAMLKDNWLFGAGVGGYPLKIIPYHASRDWMEIYPMPHTIIFNFWSEMGLLGLGAFLWLLEKFTRMCYKLLKSDSGSSLWKREGGRDLLVISALAAMTVILIHGLVDVPILKNDLSILFWIIYTIPFLNQEL